MVLVAISFIIINACELIIQMCMFRLHNRFVIVSIFMMMNLMPPPIPPMDHDGRSFVRLIWDAHFVCVCVCLWMHEIRKLLSFDGYHVPCRLMCCSCYV